MNWGVKIVISLAAFIIFIVASCIYMISRDTDSLEDEDYYEKSLTYDEVYARKSNLEVDKATPIIKVSNDTLYVHFTKSDNQGKLLFKRPSDASLDISLPFATKGETFQLPLSTFVKGSWNLDVAWSNNQKSYLSSHRIFL
ncbi:FixH family protein [Sphingobacterium sp. MYb382]|uniref:FixH family protein n=1 Tax=Sphingobacterium sp. MYb382 TaxID=2745278 RepID=UPI0030AD9A33